VSHLFAGYAQCRPVGLPVLDGYKPVLGREYTVGEHTEGLDANRWGAKLNFEPKNFTIELVTAAPAIRPTLRTRSPTTRRSVARRLCPAEVSIEIGTFGSTGRPACRGRRRPLLHRGGVRRTRPAAPPARRLLIYNMGYDGNPIATGQTAVSHAYAAEIYYPIFRHWRR